MTHHTEQWIPVAIELESTANHSNPYTAITVEARFTNEHGREILRPAFWDGGSRWVIRFAPPGDGKRWTFTTSCSEPDDGGLQGQSGVVEVEEYRGENPLLRHGLLRMSPGRRTVIHADGTPFLMVADTPWALPFRGTPESVSTYAANRRERGFNAALLMSVQPDQRAEGPGDRNAPGGFGIGFHDLSDGHLNRPDIDYFRQLDDLIAILVDHGIVPVYSPVFQGFGWKGLGTLGGSAVPDEYARYVRYLIARYGASPAMWLVSADGTGKEPVVEPAGREIEKWDAYAQPTGIHYSPFDDIKANWSDDPKFGFHGNKSHQEADWLDFQWAQTGHDGQHLPHKVQRMVENRPVKAVANGEPTYEGMGRLERAAGWWQGHEAWLNLTSGGTMGVVYGAGGLWNWKITPDEPGWPGWADSQASWSDAIEFQGSRYVGFLNRAFAGFDFTDVEKRPDLASETNLLAVPGRFYLGYLPEGGTIEIKDVPDGTPWRWFNPRAGSFVGGGTTRERQSTFTAPDSGPWVLLLGHRKLD